MKLHHARRRRAALLLGLAGLAGMGCATGRVAGPAAQAGTPGAADGPSSTDDRPTPTRPLTLVAGNAGTFYARIEPAPGAMPLNEDFGLSVWLYEDAGMTRPLEGVELFVDARMPAHGHGMNQEVRPLRQADGSWRVEGMLLHMFGHWELYVDVTRGARTERAQLDIELE